MNLEQSAFSTKTANTWTESLQNFYVEPPATSDYDSIWK